MSEENHRGVGRRKFLTYVGIGGVASTAAALFGATLRYLFPAVFYEPSSISKVGRPTEFPEGSVTFLQDEKVFLHRTREGMFALSAICTHLGCVVAKEDRGFHCPCHGSVFDAKGKVVRGPAPRALPWLEVSLATDGQVVVNRSRAVSAGTVLAV